MVKISDFVYPELKTTQKLSSTGDNFLIWKLKFSFVLTDHQLPHLIDPSPEDPTWNDKNRDAKYLILNTLDDNLLVEFSKHPTPSSIMGALLTRFNHRLKVFASIMLRRYRNHRMPVDAHINQHVFRMRAMANELDYAAGIKIPDEVQTLCLLNSLPEGWEEDVEGLLRDLDVGNESLSFLNVSRRLRVLQDVKKLKKFMHGEKLNKSFNGHCYNCGKRGHYKSDCPDQGSSKKGSSSQFMEFPLGGETLSEILYFVLKSRARIDYKGGSFFSLWKRDISSVLEDNKVDYVLKGPKPSESSGSASEEDAHRNKKWHVDDFTCRHLILGTMEDDVFLSFHSYPTAKDLMDAVEAFFSSTSTAHKLVRLKKYLNHRMAEDTLIMDHIIKMDLKAIKLERAGLGIPSEMQSVVLMDSLPGSWDKTLSTLDVNICMDEENGLSIDNVRKRVRDAGQIKELMAQKDDSTFNDNTNRKNRRVLRGKCYSCGRSGHYQADCPDS